MGMRNSEPVLTTYVQVSTIALGSLAIVANSSTMPELVEAFRAGLPGRGVDVVWPLSKRPVCLPSSQNLGDDEMNFLADGFITQVLKTFGSYGQHL